MHCLSKRNLYFRELTRGRTGSPVHPSEDRKMVLCMLSTQGHCLSKRNLYFSELTRGRTGSPEHPSENRRYDIMHVKYTKALSF